MSFLFGVGVCCMIISIWGVLQLTFMGLFYILESTVLIEDVEAKTFTDYADFIEKTQDNYKKVAINCWIAAALYLLFLIISCLCIRKAKRDERLAAERLEDDELACTPPPIKVHNVKIVKKKTDNKTKPRK